MATKELQPKTSDRVWFSSGLKLNLGDYQSASVDCGMTTDVRQGETPSTAVTRCRTFVEMELEKQSLRIRKGLWDKVV